MIYEKNIPSSPEGPLLYQDIIRLLTCRQSEVLYLIVSGFSIKMTARQLAIGTETVKYHLEQIKLKLDCKNTSDLIQMCFDKKVQIHLHHAYYAVKTETNPHFLGGVLTS